MTHPIELSSGRGLRSLPLSWALVFRGSVGRALDAGDWIGSGKLWNADRFETTENLWRDGPPTAPSASRRCFGIASSRPCPSENRRTPSFLGSSNRSAS